MDATNQEPTKRCPYCGEQILAVAIKCKHCGSMISNEVAASAASGPDSMSAPAMPAEGPIRPLSAPTTPGVTILETKERPPSGAFRIWRMLLASLLILVVAPIPSLNARQLERGTAFWADILNKMSDSDTALVHPKAVKVARGGLSSRDRDLIRELERMSPKDRFLFCAAANCDLLDPFGGEVPKVLTRTEIVAVFRAVSEREEQGNARIGVSYLLCVAAVACSALSLRRRPWLQGEMSIARSGRSAVAFRMGLVAMGMALVAGGWAAYLAVIASRLPGIVPIGMGAGCISLAWVASRFFADANRLRSTGASGTT